MAHGQINYSEVDAIQVSMAKYLECPDCGFVFKAPIADIKLTHLGFTFPGLGLVRCPECKEEKRRREYRIVQESDSTMEPAPISDNVEIQKMTAENDSVDDPNLGNR